MTESATPPVRDRVASVTNAVLKVAHDAGASDLVDRISVEAQLWSRPEVTVVVVGESQTGKSSLVNSLLGRQLVPVGAAAGTGHYVVVRHGRDNAIVHVGDASEPRAVALDELDRWLGPMAERPSAGVRGAEVHVEAAELASGLVLVDTPSLGAGDEAADRITLAALAGADAVLFVVDAGRPISGPSLRFLAEATRRIDTVVVALTKIDRFRGWRQVATDDRSALASSVPALSSTPIVPVSNRLKAMADEAAAAGTPDAQLLDESGVLRLSSELRARVVDRKQLLRLANLLRVDGGVLDELDGRTGVLIDAGSTSSAVQAEVDRDQADLDELRLSAEQAQIRITDGFAALRDSATAQVNLALRDLGVRLEEQARARGAPPLADLVDLELRAIDAELAESIDTEAQRIAEDAGSLVAVALRVGDHGGLDLTAGPAGDGAGGTDDLAARLRISMAGAVASSGTGMALFASRLTTPSGSGMLLALFGATATIGMVVAGLNLRMMKRQADVQTTRRQIQAVAETVRTSAGPAIRQRVLQAQREVEAAMKAEVRARTRTLQQAIADGTRLAKADAAERQMAAAAARARQVEVERVRAALQALSAEISTGG